jgi:GT2 family glycosyltransferase
MAVDVVVVNYHTTDLLFDFIASYEKYKTVGCHLYIIDIQPESGMLYPKEYTYISTEENLGYGRACNLGASLGNNSVILLANADTLLSEGFEECYEELLRHDDWGVLGPRQVDDQNKITAGGIIGEDWSPRQRGWAEQDHGLYSDVVETALSVSGALYFVKRAVWDELTGCPLYQQYSPGAVGAFLETPHYFDEMFCSLHSRFHGHKTVYYGPVVMTHLWHRSSPHGGWADSQFNISQQMHRDACALHGIPCE